MHVLVAVHRCIIIYFFNVENKELGTRSRECAVSEALSCGEAGVVCGGDVCVGPERSDLVWRGFRRGGDEVWRSHLRS